MGGETVVQLNSFVVILWPQRSQRPLGTSLYCFPESSVRHSWVQPQAWTEPSCWGSSGHSVATTFSATQKRKQCYALNMLFCFWMCCTCSDVQLVENNFRTVCGSEILKKKCAMPCFLVRPSLRYLYCLSCQGSDMLREGKILLLVCSKHRMCLLDGCGR